MNSFIESSYDSDDSSTGVTADRVLTQGTGASPEKVTYLQTELY